LTRADKKSLGELAISIAPGVISVALAGAVTFTIVQKDVAANSEDIKVLKAKANSDHEALADIRTKVGILLDRSDRDVKAKGN